MKRKFIPVIICFLICAILGACSDAKNNTNEKENNKTDDHEFINNYSLLITVEFTNDSSISQEPSFVWMNYVSLFQNQDKTISQLIPSYDYSLLDEYTKTADYAIQKVKPGATVECVFAYELIDTTSPVALVVLKNYTEELGIKVYKLQ